MNIKKIIAILIGVVSVAGIITIGISMTRKQGSLSDNLPGGFFAQDKKTEKIQTSDPKLLGKYGPYDDVVDFNISDNKLIVGYIKNGKYWVEVKGQKFGPFDDPNPIDFDGPEKDSNYVYYNVFATNDAWAFSARRDGKWYVNANGQEYGPFTLGVSLNVQGAGVGFSYLQGRDMFFNVNGKVFGPYGPYDEKTTLDERRNYAQMYIENNKWAFAYRNKNQCFVNINGNDFGPLQCEAGVSEHWSDWTGEWSATEEFKHWAFFYRKNGKAFLKTDQTEYGPYEIEGDGLSNFSVEMKDDRIIFSYLLSNQWYFSVDGKKYGPYEKIDSVRFRGAGWLVEYVRAGKNWFMVNGKEYGPFSEMLVGNIGEKHFIFTACTDTNDKKCPNYAIVDGISYGPYDNVSAFNEAGDEWGFSFKKGGSWTANLNGKEYGPYFPKDLVCSLNSFGDEIEIREHYTSDSTGIVGYPYQASDKKWRINISGVEFGGYEAVGCDPFRANKNQVALNYKKDGGWFVEVLPFKK